MNEKRIPALLLVCLLLMSFCAVAQAETAPTKLKFLYSTSYTFPEGEDENNNAYIQAIEDATHTDIEVVYVPASDVVSKVTTIIASGEEFDLLKLSGQNAAAMNAMSRLISSGAVAALDDAIAKVAPEIYDMIPEDILPSISKDGNLYAVCSYSMPGSQVLYIRQDWLDNLSLDMPTTIDEAYEVIRAFKNNDPDKDGEDDTIGIIIDKSIGFSGAFLGAFGVQYGIWQSAEEGLTYSNVNDNMRSALEWLHSLYSEGLLDEGFTVASTAEIREMISTGKCGYAVMGWSETRVSLENAIKNDNAVWAVAPFPVGPNGEYGIAERSKVHTMFFVPSTSKNVEKMVEVLYYGATAYQDLCYYGANGEIRQVNADGTMTLNDDMHKKFQYRGEYLPIVDYERFQAEELQRLNGLGEYWRLIETLTAASSAPINNEFKGLPTEEISKLSSALSTYELEAFTDFITGDRSLDEWNDWVSEWMNLGGERYTELVNEWYEAQ